MKSSKSSNATETPEPLPGETWNVKDHGVVIVSAKMFPDTYLCRIPTGPMSYSVRLVATKEFLAKVAADPRD